MFKVIIAGGRDFKNYPLLCRVCDHMLKNQSEVEIVSGMANGADALGQLYSLEKKYKVKPFPADWDKLKSSAGPVRNKEMAKYADALIAFWDGKSRGTENMIQEAKNNNLKVKVVEY